MPISSGSRAETDAPRSPDRTSRTSDDDLSAAKRVALGLTPRRPTAKAIPQRPPDVDVLPASSRRWLPALLIGIVVLTALLVVANLWAGSSARSERQEANIPGARVIDGAFSYRVILSDSFDSETSVLSDGDNPRGWHIELLPSSGVYRMDVCCEQFAYSLPGDGVLGPHSIQSGAQVDADSPWGFVGIIERHDAGDEDFYTFLVDGYGQYKVEMYRDGRLRTLQGWTKSSALNASGNINVIAVEDLGDRLRFFGNNILLYDLTEVELLPGAAGLVGGSTQQEAAELEFDWFQMFDLVPSDTSATATP